MPHRATPADRPARAATGAIPPSTAVLGLDTVDAQAAGKVLIVAGLVVVVLGALLVIASALIVSVVLTVVLDLLLRR